MAKKVVVTKWKMTSPRAYLWRAKNRFVRPGQILIGREEDLPEDLKSMLTPVYEPVVSSVRSKSIVRTTKIEDTPPKEETAEVKKPTYWIKAKFGGSFDIFSNEGKKVNEQPLPSREDAEAMIKELEG